MAHGWQLWYLGHFLEKKADFPWLQNIARTRGRRKRRRRRRHCACWWNGISLYSSPFSSHFTTFPGTYIFLKLLIPEKPAIILLIHNQLVLLLSRKKFSFKTNCCVGLWKIIKAIKVLLVSKSRPEVCTRAFFKGQILRKLLPAKAPSKACFSWYWGPKKVLSTEEK